MKFSEQWLREWVNPPVSTEALAEQLTMAGMEVDEVVAAAPDLSGIVAARVEAVSAHPDAHSLCVCTVKKDAGAPVTVVTGAPGVTPGCCYPYAGVGTRLPGSVAIRELDIRGVASTGMLCSAAELGLSDEADVLLLLAAECEPGAPLTRAMRLDDQVFDVGLTPNRGDCLSIHGMAREVAAVNRMKLEPPPGEVPAPAVRAHVRAVHLAAPDGCARYLGRIINHIDPARPSPLWMREKLRRCGLRSLNPVVDVTNYVMLELGQPLHAFDNDKLQGAITVRYAAEGETLTLLDGAARVMPASTLVIADAARAVAMAGVMGGRDTAVSGSTRHVFLESAFFAPLVIAGRARQFGLHTDASHRFERGVDFTLQRRAMERATRLLLEICGGEPGPVTEALDERALPPRQVVGLRPGAATALLGETITTETCVEILTRLGLREVAGSADVRRFSVPPHRFDITLEADLVEEVARVYGYHNITSALPPARLSMRKPGFRERLGQARGVLVSRGYREALTYSFVGHALQSLLFPELAGVSLLNAISTDMERMRVSLWPGLLTALQHNLNHRQARVRLFETGKIFRADGELRQTPAVAGLSCGPVQPEQWGQRNADGDFYDIKSDLEAVLTACCGSIAPDYRPVTVTSLHQGKAAQVLYHGQPVGLLGALHPAIQSQLEIDTEVYLFELYLEQIPPRDARGYRDISRFPVVKRDLSVLVDSEIPSARLLQSINAVKLTLAASEPTPEQENFLADLELTDVYQGEPVPAGKKSVTFGLTFQKISDTLISQQADDMMEQILDTLRGEFGAQLRE